MSRLSALLPLLCLASPLLAAVRTPEIAVSEAVLNDGSVGDSILFLERQPLQERLKAQDEPLFIKTFARAAELKDLYDLLRGRTGPGIIRLGLLGRPNCTFCQKPSEMRTWAEREVGPYESERLRVVYWDWKTLSDAQRGWLSAHGETPESWAALELTPRRARLQEWAEGETAALMSVNPSTPKELEELRDRVIQIEGIRGPLNVAALETHFNQAAVIVQKISSARKMLTEASDPRLLNALNEAQTASTPEARLAALAKIFDGLGRPDAAVMGASDGGTGQRFDERSRRLVAEIIAAGVMHELDGTWAGMELQEFYSQHPMNLAIAPMTMAALALYKDGKLTFNEQQLEAYVKSRDRTLDDLTRDPELAKSLIYTILPMFVHEATHQRQDAWRKEQGIPLWAGEGLEAEAMMAEGVFVLQKSKNDSAYRRFLEQNKDGSILIREELSIANRLQFDGADLYGPEVMRTHYPEFLSIAGQAWCFVIWHNDVADILEKELERRKKLPAAVRLTLASRNNSTVYSSKEEFAKDIGAWGTAQLKRYLAEQRQQARLSVEAYAKYSARLKSAKAAVDAHLFELDASPVQAANGVPAPPR